MNALDRRKLLISACGLAGGMAVGSAVSVAMVRKDREPVVTVLGSGQSLSILIGSERARLAILHGSDPADFGNALRQARMPLLGRTDIAIVPAPESTGQTFLRSALAQLGDTKILASGDATALLDAGIRVDQTLTATASINLPGHITVTLPERPDDAWQAVVALDGATVVLSLGDSQALQLSGEVSIWVQIDSALPDLDRLSASRPAEVVIPASAMSGSSARDYQQAASWSLAVTRVHAGDAKRLEFG